MGQLGGRGWTFKDYGGDASGDALGYMVDVRGMTFVDAVAELCRLTGTRLEGWGADKKDALGCPPRPERDGVPYPNPPPTPSCALPPTLPPEAQRDAALAFLDALESLCPDAADQGADYLASRGCLAACWQGAAWVLPADACKPLAAKLAACPDAGLLTHARLLKPAEGDKPLRLAWWDRVCLLGCYDAAGRLDYFVGRRLDWKDGDRWGKYINQGTGGGAVREPYNLPALYHAAGRAPWWPMLPAPDKAGDVLLVEGPLDALGAACLGWPAVAMLTRLQVHNHADREGAAARTLEAHLPALRDVRRVRVVPDADPGQKGAEGEALAARLVGWLRFAGVRADLATLADLCPDAPEACKDLGDVSKARFNPLRIEPLPAVLTEGATIEA